MIVEDEKSIAGFIKAILNSNGYDAMVIPTAMTPWWHRAAVKPSP